MSSVRSAWFLFPLVALLCLAVQASAQTLPKAPVVDPADEPLKFEGVPDTGEVDKLLAEETEKLEKQGFPPPDRGSKERRWAAVVANALWHSLRPEQQKEAGAKPIAHDELPEALRKPLRLLLYMRMYRQDTKERGSVPPQLVDALRQGHFNLRYTTPPGAQGYRFTVRTEWAPGHVVSLGFGSSVGVSPPRRR